LSYSVVIITKFHHPCSFIWHACWNKIKYVRNKFNLLFAILNWIYSGRLLNHRLHFLSDKDTWYFFEINLVASLCQLRIVELIRNESVCESNVGKNCFISYLFHRKNNPYVSWANALVLFSQKSKKITKLVASKHFILNVSLF
jgi:hypothetical protein